MLEGLRDESLDAALLASSSKSALRGLKFKEIKSYDTRVAVSPLHSLGDKQTIPLRTIVDERLIAYSQKDYPEYTVSLKKLFSKFGAMPTIGEEHDSVTSLIAAVESGRGVAIVSSSLACMSGDRLKLIPVSPAPKPLIVGLASRPRNVEARLKKFIQSVTEVGRELA